MYERELMSNTEIPIMKILWDTDHEMTAPELMERIEELYGKKYKRTSISTFLQHLSDKGFVEVTRHGTFAYIHITRPIEEYTDFVRNHEIDFWYNGRMSELLESYCKNNTLSKDETARIRALMDQQDMINEDVEGHCKRQYFEPDPWAEN